MAQTRRVPVRRKDNDPRRRGAALPGWAMGMVVGAFLVTTAFAGYLIFTSVRALVSGWTLTGGPIGPVDPAVGHSGGAEATPHLSSTPQVWNGQDRVTLLVLGVDQRPGEEDVPRSDSLILMTIDPATLTAGVLSIPRDLWVYIPNYGHAKINNAYYNGDKDRYPYGGGAGLAMETVENFLGVPIDHYVTVNFHAFETLIDQIGGIEVDNPTEINDPLYPDCCYGYDPFHLPVGRQHLDGHNALRYARTRHDSDDIQRARRQQQVILAVRERVLSLNMLPSLVAQAPAMYTTVQDGVNTDLTLDEIVSLALLAQQVPQANIRTVVLDYTAMEPATSPDGLDILRPIPGKVRELRDQLFSTDGALAPAAVEGDLASLAKAEGARIVVQNGTYTDGLAGATSEYLRGLGLNVVDAVTAPDRGDFGYPTSVIKDYTGTPYTTRLLAQLMNVSPAGILSGNDPNSTVDIVVVVGNDWVVPSP